MSKPFHEKRRQQSLTEAYYRASAAHFGGTLDYWSVNTPEADSALQAASLAASSVADDLSMLWTIRYTAGEPIEQLRAELSGVVEAYERYQVALSASKKRTAPRSFSFVRSGTTNG